LPPASPARQRCFRIQLREHSATDRHARCRGGRVRKTTARLKPSSSFSCQAATTARPRTHQRATPIGTGAPASGPPRRRPFSTSDGYGCMHAHRQPSHPRSTRAQRCRRPGRAATRASGGRVAEAVRERSPPNPVADVKSWLLRARTGTLAPERVGRARRAAASSPIQHSARLKAG